MFKGGSEIKKVSFAYLLHWVKKWQTNSLTIAGVKSKPILEVAD